ncbi:MAG: HD domain-containing protein [Syntrophobacterales bacterium]|jgi:3'-5' exoribonuclease|nr:HD domain-containing protein [Syntrophobacterales bacterium]
MPHQLISDLREGVAVQQFFIVRQAETRTDKSGKPYLSLVLGDKSGTIVTRVWNDILAKCPGPFAPGDHVAVQAQVESYKGELQLNVRYINTVQALRDLGRDLKEYDPDLLYQATAYNREVLWQELWQLAETRIRPPLQQLVLNLLSHHREELMVCPAARLYHHPYVGGLLEHTWFVARHAVASLTIYPDLNPDLVLAGAILHDLGKVKEIANPTAPELTAAGQLLGHIVLGWDLVRAAAQTLEFPDPTLLLQLEHIILSHHGAVEFGSPILPKTREAFLVNFLDDLDAKLKMMSQHLESDTGEGDFTTYHRVLQRGLYKGGPVAAAEPESSSETEK